MLFRSQKKSKIFLFLDLLTPSIYLVSCALLSIRIISTKNSLLIYWFIFLSGFPACFRISSIIVAHITKSKLKCALSFYPIEFLPIFVFILNVFSPQFFQFSLIICTLVSFFIYLQTFHLIIQDICNYLDIYCLSIKSK